jgi:hypothetical protein
MKRFLLFLLPVILLASCGARYSNAVDYREVAQTCKFTGLTDSVQLLGTEGFASVSPVPGGTVEVCDSVYVVSRTWKQAWSYEVANGYTVWFWLGIILLAGGIVAFIILQNKGIGGTPAVVGLCVVILISGALIGNSASWAKWNSSRQIKKIDYVQTYSQSDAAKDAFWAAPAKSY